MILQEEESHGEINKISNSNSIYLNFDFNKYEEVNIDESKTIS